MFWLSGAFFPTDDLPKWADIAANLFPLFHAVALSRALTTGEPPDARRSTLASAEDLAEVLRDRCGLAISDGALAQIWARIEQAPERR